MLLERIRVDHKASAATPGKLEEDLVPTWRNGADSILLLV
jgi:hypothetical protein